jgi:hypothetical protein
MSLRILGALELDDGRAMIQSPDILHGLSTWGSRFTVARVIIFKIMFLYTAKKDV